MNKQDMLKVQTCVLRVHIHCHGCKDKVMKKLQKVQGVYKVIIDEEQGKVMVSGNVDPAILIEKLEKAGKHAELWGGQNRQVPMNNMFNNFQGGNMKINSGSQKGGKKQQNGGNQAPLQNKAVKFSAKDLKSAKFNSSEDEEEEYEDENSYHDSDEEFEAHHPPVKAVKVPQKSNATASSNGGHPKGHNPASNGEKGKKGRGFDAVLKGMIGKAIGKNGNDDKNSVSKTEKGNPNKKVGTNRDFHDLEGKVGAKSGKIGAKSHDNGKNNDSWLKKGGKKFDGGSKLEDKQKGFESNENHHGGMGGRKVGAVNNYPMGLMGNFPSSNGYQTGNFPAAQGLPAGSMNEDRIHGQGHAFNQQQYMAQMMMMNQQRGNGQDMYHPAMFNRPQPPMNYGPPPPPPNDPFTHIFSDENTNSCSIM